MDSKEEVPDELIGPLVDHPEYVTPTRILSRPVEKAAKVAEITSRSDENKVKDDESQIKSDRSSLGDDEEVMLPTIPTTIAAIKVAQGDDHVKSEIDDQAAIPISAITESPFPIHMDEDSSRSPV